MKPIIAIFGAVNDDNASTFQHAYSYAIEKMGAIPILIPYTENEETISETVSLCDGFLFSGGVDVEPIKYGEETKPACGNIQLKRDSLELEYFKRIFDTGKPILAICRGAQVVNVALGGTLYQDIPTEIVTDIPHRQSEPKFSPSHSVSVIADTPLFELIGKEKMAANSFHHQAIKALGDGLCVMALADDTIIEAVYYTGDRFIRAYQWHPERLFNTDADNALIFKEFIDECERTKQ